MKKYLLNTLRQLILTAIIFAVFSTGTAFADTFYDRENLQQSEEMQPRSDVAFILVYMSTCPHCQRFDPILKDYVVAHHIPVLAYTLNGIALPSFQDSITPTQAEIQKLFPDGNPVVPSLFVVDQKHHQIIRALTGEASAAQLQDRMIQIEGMMMQNHLDETKDSQNQTQMENSDAI